MKLYIRQKVFSLVDKFTVKDASGNDVYFVAGEFLSWGKKLHIKDTNNNEVAFIQQKVISFRPKFFVFVNGVQVAEIIKEFTFFRPNYRIRGLRWEIKGSLFAYNYQITQDGIPIATIHKQWMSWGDCYELDIANQQDEIIALSVVLAIDCVMDQKD